MTGGVLTALLAGPGIEASLPVPKARAPSAVRGNHDVFDDSATQLRAIESGQVDKPEQVAEGVGPALALAPTIDYELALRTQRRCERLEGRLELAQTRGSEGVATGGGKVMK